MQAIIRQSGHQFSVAPETVIEVNRVALEEGAAFETDQILMITEEGQPPRIGTPLVAGAKVKGKILGHLRGPKILVFKMKRRKRYRRTRGHRQELTRIQIDSIDVS